MGHGISARRNHASEAGGCNADTVRAATGTMRTVTYTRYQLQGPGRPGLGGAFLIDLIAINVTMRDFSRWKICYSRD